MPLKNYIIADTYRIFGQFGWKCVAKGFLQDRNFRVVITMRICNALSNSSGALRLIRPFFKILYRIVSSLAATELPYRTKIGKGLALTHGWGLVVSEGAVIGNNVTLFNGVTIGRRDRISNQGVRQIEYPTLEDEVWVGPHAIIVGGVTIGKGSRIAGGAFVTESVPPYSVVVGNPAQITKSNCMPDVMNPAPL